MNTAHLKLSQMISLAFVTAMVLFFTLTVTAETSPLLSAPTLQSPASSHAQSIEAADVESS